MIRKAPRLTRQTPMERVRRTVAQRVRRMTAEQLADWMTRYAANWAAHRSVVSEPVKELTGGFNSQSINAYVVRRVYDEQRKRARAS